ncbi:hypothetical protein BDD43_2854 [Mucilaginibacter gracilis]|uniref:Uncharacterized protein n=1 Tax=Mucilaginibacter gracilis TaxID=423350 RepID=A0A495J3T9_9SPHI|nr:hypothetical protein [Mucilaginibacter gracilis]RKR82669.1 hypothetical protein BDD43_2854 [Mucilaginibacter gracilis]
MEDILSQLLAGIQNIQSDIATIKRDIEKINSRYNYLDDKPSEKKPTKKQRELAELNQMRHEAHLRVINRIHKSK